MSRRDRLRVPTPVIDREAPLAFAVEHCPSPIAVLDREMRYLACSRSWLTAFGVEPQSVQGRSHYEVFPEIPQRWKDIHRRSLAGEVQCSEEDAFVRLDGSVTRLRWELRPWCTKAGEVGGIVMYAEIITAQKKAEEDLRISEERLRLAITGAALGTWHLDLRTGELVWSDLSFAMFGMAPDPAMNFEKFMGAVHPDDRARVQESVARAVRERTDFDTELRAQWPDGTVRWLSAKGRPFYEADGTVVRMEGVALDITERKQVEQALRAGETRFRELAEAVPHLVWQLAPSGALIYANARWRDYFGRDALELFQWSEVVHPDDLAAVAGGWGEMTRAEYNIPPFRMRRHDGTYHWFVCRTVPVRDAEGKLERIVGTSTDVEQLKETEEALRVSRARLDAALRAAGMGTWVWDIETDHVESDEALIQLFGFTEQDWQTRTLDDLLPRVDPEDREMVRLALSRARDHAAAFDVECRMLRGDARLLWVAAKGRVEKDAQGRAVRMFGACVDITHHKRLEEELRQAHKMEAIGRLAGGVAHDFNNLLTVILGQASMVSLRQDLPHSVSEAVEDIASAAERAASLTAQLLAFGRRQLMQPRKLKLNEVVANVSTMLRRLLGENIALLVEPAEAEPRVDADPNMLAQVLLNLAVNARDAMPRGGRLTIRTAIEQIEEGPTLRAPDAIPGTWACLSVSDTGAGISGSDLAQIFEPFFTTKDVGKGTGLGLATVYGIMKQHRGWVSVDSTVGQGTTFKAYLPLVSGDVGIQAADPQHTRATHGRGELILLVEDESGVRSVVKSILEQHGYRLIVVNDGREALEAFREHRLEIDLLLTDVVMPHGVSGTELVAEVQAQNPGLKAILCSGYSADTIGWGLTAQPRAAFLQKPYRSENLLSLVRRVLDDA